jgi:hypothetical protein
VVIAIIGANGFGTVLGVAASDVAVRVAKFAAASAGRAENTAAIGAAAAGCGAVALAGVAAAGGVTEVFA